MSASSAHPETKPGERFFIALTATEATIKMLEHNRITKGLVVRDHTLKAYTHELKELLAARPCGCESHQLKSVVAELVDATDVQKRFQNLRGQLYAVS